MTRVHLFGGFLGAGKTTLLRTLAEHLSERGEQVALITNDQGNLLVDTSLCRATADDVREICGGCFCCQFDELEQTILSVSSAGATVVLAEAVGSCTDLLATVLAPLADRHPERLELAPLTVVVDPWRVEEFRTGKLHPDVAYLFAKQIEEADILVLTRIDLAPPDVREPLRELRPDATVVAVSGLTGEGLWDWLSAPIVRPAALLDIDYDRYASAEALLGWCNARVKITSDAPFSPRVVVEKFLSRMASFPIAHLKIAGLEPPGGRAAIVRAGDTPNLDWDEPRELQAMALLVNARIAMDPVALMDALKHSMFEAAGQAKVIWEELEAFRPARPVPTHRYALRCKPVSEASCCAAFYDRTDVRALLGDSWHPGGVELTLKMASGLRLSEGGDLLDVACGSGASLQALLERYPIRATGLDAQARFSDTQRMTVRQGDVHAIPFPERSFDAILCECALSTFHDQAAALREMLRVLRPGGRIVLSDMAVEGQIPESLRPWVHTGTCLSRAMTRLAYARTLGEAGFLVIESQDETWALRELLRRIKKNLVGAAFAAASGALGAEVHFDMKQVRATLREAERVVDAGIVGYTTLLAEKPR